MNINDLDSIFDNISEYYDKIDDLIKSLKTCGITNYDNFLSAAKERSTPIPKRVQRLIEEKYADSENDDWKDTLQANTKEAYQKYLNDYPEGSHREEARNNIDELIKKIEQSHSDDAWISVNKDSIESLQSFVDNYPYSTHIPEATNLLRELRKQNFLGVDICALTKQIKAIRADATVNNPENVIFDLIYKYITDNKVSKDDLLAAIAADNNIISGTVAYRLWENRIITDFSKAGIERNFITQMMANIHPQSFQAPVSIKKITKSPCTEVYFWGIPSSGKSCALGAILSAASNGRTAKSMQRDPDCQGYGYMTRLANLFKMNGEVGTLPEGTAISSTYEMGFILEDEDGKEHPITCIDLAGELVRCMYKQDAHEALTKEQGSVLTTLTNILIDNRTNNRKIHFFVIEYGAEDREYEGLPQKEYLNAAVAYIQRTGIFKKDTDGIYILITKVDKAKTNGRELQEKLKSYISNNYNGFYNGLKKICKDNEINGGIVEIQPFTLGNVCFQNFCQFKEDTAATVVSTIIKRSYGYKPGKLNKILNTLKK